MPLQVKLQVEPFTQVSKSQPPVLAVSTEYNRLHRDLMRYTLGQISGRSYLIAGHRGSGKTMLVHKAIEDVLRESLNYDSRPLFVRLHGPDLLPPQSSSQNEAGRGASGDKAAAATTTPDLTKLLQCPLRDAGNGAKDKQVNQTAQPGEGDDPGRQELVNVLTQMMKCLFRDVTAEFQKCIRERVLLTTDKGRWRQDLLEVVAQFDLEMPECPSAARLRSFWERIGALKDGVLFHYRRGGSHAIYDSPNIPYGGYPGSTPRMYNPAISSYPIMNYDFTAYQPLTDAGMQEIVVLAQLSQAFQVIAGKLEETQKQAESGKSEQSASLSTAYALKNLLAPFTGLATGSGVGAAVALTGKGPVTAVLLGLLTGAVVSFGFSYSSSRSRSREMSRESVFVRDRSVATLSSVLPLLVTRLRSIGLAPIFVIDELDKVQDLQTRMQKLVQQLKYLVTENSFSCFLADRRYLSRLNRQANELAYAPEYTYFSDRLLVLYEPSELRRFVVESFDATQPGQPKSEDQAKALQAKEKEDKEKIAYVIAHRARLHPVDVRRQIDRLAGRNTFSIEDFPTPGYRFEILAQVAIEWLLDGDDVRTQIAGNPDSRQVIYDALYYVSRLWEDASSAEVQRVPGFKDFGEAPGERKPGFLLSDGTFSEYIESRAITEEESKPGDAVATATPASPAAKVKRLSGTDFDLLLIKVRELLSYLANPVEFYNLIDASTRSKPPKYILNEIPREALLEKRGNQPEYEWRYDVSGRELRTREVTAVVAEVRPAMSRIKEIATNIDSLGKSLGGLQALADCKVIPRTPEWSLVRQAVDRLSPLLISNTPEPYPKMGADRDCVVEYGNTLSDFEENIKAVLECSSIFAVDAGGSVVSAGSTPKDTQAAQLYSSLFRVTALLKLSTAKEDDVRKLKLVIDSKYGQAPPVKPESEWTAVLNFVLQQLKRPSVTDQKPLTDAAWSNWKSRFAQHFRDGTSQFDPLADDIFCHLLAVDPGNSLSFDLSGMTAATWTTLLLRSLQEDPKIATPAWMRVAASLELGFPDLAEKLARTVAGDTDCSQWVRDAKSRQNAAAAATRRTALVLAAEQSSLTTTLKMTPRSAAIVATVSDFTSLLDALRKQKISGPNDFPVKTLRIELKGDPATLGSLVTQKPASAVSTMSGVRSGSKGGGITKDIDAFLNLEDFAYCLPEPPQIPTNTTPMSFLLAPKSLDDLLGFSDPMIRT